MLVIILWGVAAVVSIFGGLRVITKQAPIPQKNRGPNRRIVVIRELEAVTFGWGLVIIYLVLVILFAIAAIT